MSKIIFKPEREKSDTRYFVGLRLAWFYRVGTILEHKGKRWIRHESVDGDSFGWWEPADV